MEVNIPQYSAYMQSFNFIPTVVPKVGLTRKSRHLKYSSVRENSFQLFNTSF